MSASSTEAYPQAAAAPSPGPLVEIVADGGRQLGFGHVGRCLALWEELGAAAAFRVTDESVAEFLTARGAPLESAGRPARVVLLDRAEPTSERDVRSLQLDGRCVVLLDDLGSGRMAADAVIDPPTAAAWPPAAGLRLSGFEHVLLRREVLAAAATSSRAGVLMAIGGSDPAGLTAPLSQAVADAGIDLTVALGPGYQGAPAAGTTIAADAFAGALGSAALLVCGYGHSLLEAAHLGVPAVSVVFRPGHLPHARAFCRHETAYMLDMTGGPRPAEIVALVADLLGDVSRRTQMAERGRQLIDGAGAARAAAALLELARGAT
jgi:spore coat polysaccharide biosynthesis predicted glycosyltransferase SpsG